MGGLFDLIGEPNGGDKGNNTVDLLDLPLNSRMIMRFILRSGSMNAEQICKAVDGLPEADRFSQAEVYEILDTLCLDNWLTRLAGEQPYLYRANMRRKGSNDAGTLSRAKHVPQGLWDALDFEAEAAKSAGDSSQPPSASSDEHGSRKKTVWDALNFDDQTDKG